MSDKVIRGELLYNDIEDAYYVEGENDEGLVLCSVYVGGDAFLGELVGKQICVTIAEVKDV